MRHSKPFPAPRRAARIAAVLLTSTLALAGCPATSPTDGGAAARSQERVTSTPAVPPSSRPPAASTLWADATRSLSARRSVHFHEWFGTDTGSASATLPPGTIIQDFDVTLDGTRVHGSQEQPGGVPRIEMLTIDGHHYEKYPEHVLRSAAGRDRKVQDALVERVGGRWVDLGTVPCSVFGDARAAAADGML